MEEKELILKLQSLKQIKPRENWVVFTKTKVLEGHLAQPVKPLYENVLSFASKLIYQNKLSYAFAVFLFVAVSLVGLNNFSPNQSLSPAALVNSNSDIEMLKVKSQNLVAAVQNNSEDIAVAVIEVKVAAENLKEAIAKDPKLAKEAAIELKSSGTLASLDGGEELKEASLDLYKAIDIQMIDDLENTTLTESQQVILEQAKELFNDKKYFEALEKILLINS